MKQQNDSATKEVLTWRKTSLFGRAYELLAGGQTVARLERSGFFNITTQIFEADEPVLQVRQSGIFTRTVHAKLLSYRFPAVADAEVSWKGNSCFVFDDGRRFAFNVENFWQTIWQLYDENGQSVARIQRDTWGNGGSITVYDSDLAADELSLLIYLCWHIVIMKMEESAAAAAAA